MSDQESKKEIFEACRLNLLASIHVLEEEMKMLRESAASDQDNGMSDRMESTDEEMMNDRQDREKYRNSLYEELSLLDSLNNSEVMHTVEPGAIVITSNRNLLVAIARTFRSGDREFTGISAAAPIYSFLEGKKAGDTYTFNDQKYTITEVY